MLRQTSTAISVVQRVALVSRIGNLMSETLNSWNEIATYLSRGVRTVQRWHLKLHLPVYKVGSNPTSPVFAYKAELDTWVRTHTERGGSVATPSNFAPGIDVNRYFPYPLLNVIDPAHQQNRL